LVVRDAATAIERTIRLKRYRQLLQLWGEASDSYERDRYQEQLTAAPKPETWQSTGAARSH
jgi:hypothetical protein